MALDLTPEQRETGARNFEVAAGELARSQKDGPTRRSFLKSAAAAGAVLPLSASVYFGYDAWKGNKAVKTALIGTGDEGGVLVGEHNPEFLEFVAVCDIRPYNRERIINGEPSGPRKGIIKHYGEKHAEQIREKGTFTTVDELLAKKDELGLEAVVIATPLVTHAPIAIKCMEAGLHVLCEKLMARDITQCKEMIRAAEKNGVVLSIGHQRHYSMLYAHTREVVESGILGDIKHIRALWHRNNSWPWDESMAKEKLAKGFDLPQLRDGWYPPIYEQDAAELNEQLVKEYGYASLPELVRWRLYDRTGGGLMAELGSHQLDACSIFLGKVKPLAVQGVGGKFFYGPGKNDRESDDGVWVTYEFPGPNHPKGANKGNDKDDIVVVTYSSFNTNSFEQYGECLMGSRGTLIVEGEQNVYLFKETQPGVANSGGKGTKVKVTTSEKGKPAMEASSTWGAAGGPAIVKTGNASGWGAISRGYREEMEHFAFCVRAWGEDKVSYEKDGEGKYTHADKLPRCHGEVAMADAILALTANMAMDKRTRIEFEDNWFDSSEDDVPETKYGKSQSA